jgi:hypothetical protein
MREREEESASAALGGYVLYCDFDQGIVCVFCDFDQGLSLSVCLSLSLTILLPKNKKKVRETLLLCIVFHLAIPTKSLL